MAKKLLSHESKVENESEKKASMPGNSSDEEDSANATAASDVQREDEKAMAASELEIKEALTEAMLELGTLRERVNLVNAAREHAVAARDEAQQALSIVERSLHEAQRRRQEEAANFEAETRGLQRALEREVQQTRREMQQKLDSAKRQFEGKGMIQRAEAEKPLAKAVFALRMGLLIAPVAMIVVFLGVLINGGASLQTTTLAAGDTLVGGSQMCNSRFRPHFTGNNARTRVCIFLDPIDGTLQVTQSMNDGELPLAPNILWSYSPELSNRRSVLSFLWAYSVKRTADGRHLQIIRANRIVTTMEEWMRNRITREKKISVFVEKGTVTVGDNKNSSDSDNESGKSNGENNKHDSSTTPGRVVFNMAVSEMPSELLTFMG